MSVIWAVARHMIAEGIRMKIALVFGVLLVMIVIGLPFSITGDDSLTGAVQSFITYALSATGFLLGILTIFLSRSLSDELVHRQIFILLTKPLSRWRYILGKWLGMTVLNACFLAFAGVAVYGLIHYIRWTHPPLEERFDAAELTNGVLVARHSLRCNLPEFPKYARDEMEKNREEGLYANVQDFSPEKEIERLTKKYEARWRVVGPLQVRVFEFDNVLVDRARTQEIQLRYKTEVSMYAQDEVFRAEWSFGNPMKGTPTHARAVRHVVGRYHTISVPADAVADDHTLTVVFSNANPFAGEPQFRNVIEFRPGDLPEVLFIVGSFEGNLFRLLVMMLFKLMFVGAVAILFTTVFSFAVACMAAFSVYVLAGARSFILEALDFTSGDRASLFDSAKEFFVQSITMAYNVLSFIVPDFARYDGIETLVNGRNVGLVWVLQAIGDLGLKTCLILGLAMLFFQRREVAEVSV